MSSALARGQYVHAKQCTAPAARTSQPIVNSGPRRSRFCCQARAGKAEPFNENAAQVRRLIDRDRKDFLGNSEDILDKYTTEFGDASTDDADSPSTSSPTPAKSPFAAAAPASPFAAFPPRGSGAATAAPAAFTSTPSSPFGTPPPKIGRSAIEPKGLAPDMSPDPIMKEKQIGFLQSINLTQVVLFFSFSTIIAIMIGTFTVVVNAGAVKIAGID